MAAVLSETTTNKLNRFYIDTLQMAEKIKENVPEKKNLYLDAFFGLLRNGMKYDIEEKMPEEEVVEDAPKAKKNSKKKKDEVIEDDPTISKDPIRTVVIIIDGVYYRASELDLQFAFGSLYDKVMENHESAKKRPVRQSTNEADAFFMPDLYTEAEDEDAALPAVQGRGDMTVSGAPRAEEEERVTLPYLPFDSNYPNDEPDLKDYDSFLFNLHDTTLRMKDGSEKKYQTYIYPLSPDMEDCLATDILAVMIDEDGKMRYGMSEPGVNGKKSVNEEYQDITFVVRGYWNNGKLISSVAVFHTKDGSQPILTDAVHPVEPTRRTSSLYLRHIVENGNVLNVFPLGLIRNDPTTGLAPCMVMLEDGKQRTVYHSDDNKYIQMTLNRETVRVTPFWTANNLNISIETINR